MVDGADKKGSLVTVNNDNRITKVGAKIRNSRLDEIPQLINVLLGDMAIIGPRPFVTTHYEGFDKLDEKGKKRLEVRPGITGYSQAYYRNSIGKEEKIDNDCYYADHVTFLLDVKIFFQTIKSVLKRENIYVTNEEQQKK